MTIERYKNDAVTQLAGAIDGVQLTIPVIDAAVFPTLTGGDQFRIRIDDEEDIIVSSVVANTLGLTNRGTGATSHSDGSDVVHNLTADSLANVVNDRDIATFQLKIGKDWGLTAVVTPSQITSNQDNYSPTGIATANALRLSTDASRDITGILAPSPEYARRLVIENIGSFDIVLKNDVTSTAANRFKFSADVTLGSNQHVELLYDTTLDRWIMLGGVGGSSVTDATISTSDITTNDVSITKHGWAPKAPNDATKYLDGTGAYSIPAGGGSSSPYWNGYNVLTPPPATGWTWDNQGGSTITTQTSDQGSTYEMLHAAIASAVRTRVRYRTAPSTPYTITVFMQWNYFGTGSNCGPLIGFRDSGGKYVFLYAIVDTGAAKLETAKWNSAISASAAYVTTTSNIVVSGWSWFRITDDGTNLISYTSPDGKNWRQFDSRLRGDFLSTGPNAICFGAYVNDADVEVALLSWEQT